MASTFNVSETYGASPGTTADTSYVHLLSGDVASGVEANHANYPVSIPPSGTSYSYEKWIRGHWTGTFTTISNIIFWKSAGTLGTGLTLNAASRGSQVYSTPVNTASSFAISAIPTDEGSALSLNYSSNFSDFVVLQAAVASTASPGANGPITYTFKWQET